MKHLILSQTVNEGELYFVLKRVTVSSDQSNTPSKNTSECALMIKSLTSQLRRKRDLQKFVIGKHSLQTKKPAQLLRIVNILLIMTAIFVLSIQLVLSSHSVFMLINILR